MNIPFTRPDITEAEVDAVVSVLRSGWLTTGPVVARFERALAARCGVGEAVCCASATAGLELVLRLLEIGPGDEVIVPAYTFSATAAAVVHVGARPVLADCLPGRFHLEPAAVEPLFSDRTAAVIGVDLAGVCCDYDALRAVCAARPTRARRGLAALVGRPWVIADAAHSLGGSLPDGRASGALADWSVFSFHAAKNLTTGEGGAITWRLPGGADTELRRALERLALHGQDRSARERERDGGVRYDILSCGYKCNLTDLQAAVGLSQLGRYDAMLARRRALIARYAAGLPDGWSALGHPAGSACHLFLALLPPEQAARRDGLLERLAARGVRANLHYRPLPMLTAYRRMGWRESDFPHAVALYRRELSLPLSSVLHGDEA
ncbi:MAG: DegT/DnrJ/EryC1/StrS aminotransferase family protein, partial [Oscillospiraceae bacterium]